MSKPLDLSYPPFPHPQLRTTIGLESGSSVMLEPCSAASLKPCSIAELPLIDLECLRKDPSYTHKLSQACRDWGFFLLVNHGVPLTLSEEAMAEVKQMFSLPFEAKQANSALPLRYLWGSPSWENKLRNVNWMEGFHIPLRGHENQDHMLLQLDPFNSFRNVMADFGHHMSRIAREVFEAIPLLHLREAKRSDYMAESEAFIRAYRYPSCDACDHFMGMEAHTDSSVLTILSLDDSRGLQIHKDGQWLDVVPPSGTLVVNLGDMMQAMSNDEYKSIEHRVVVNDATDRISICYFSFPEHEAPISSPNYRKFTYKEFRSQVQEDIKSSGFKVGLDRFRLNQCLKNQNQTTTGLIVIHPV
ncbi:hypothetical protein AMTRI_Chr08g208640 [Amborella trichopoda]|uniref:Fe2OG dioxygenase domain-containing protein n=1 Tax=Amborella trichopoda TaxID=13333 RepID=W1PBH3_AMBTC|nr:gibberellin 2-beta-dioxygenase 8 [Amborella trichopoda]ERN05283.1 hypothetical protein AMTR_s00007p00142460 [Amborella trichopoda]|eukprot:XP_011623152.2 gibberellin 2-beta-dioxygenase 8 [Amborella trichopoda]